MKAFYFENKIGSSGVILETLGIIRYETGWFHSWRRLHGVGDTFRTFRSSNRFTTLRKATDEEIKYYKTQAIFQMIDPNSPPGEV